VGDAAEAADPDLSYELRDTSSGNRLSHFTSEADALEGVRETVAVNGVRLVESLVLDAIDRSGNHHPVVRGWDLGRLAGVPTATAASDEAAEADGGAGGSADAAREAEASRPADAPAEPESGAQRAGVPAAAPESDQETEAGSARLRPGALRDMVLAHLRERPGQSHSPTAIGKALARSAGAVANACEKLAADGVITQTSEKPRQYRSF
jgi:hypothetical protein